MPYAESSGEADPTSPLLERSASLLAEDVRASGFTAEPPLYGYTIACIFVLIFVVDIGGSLVDTPEVRLLEMAVCRDYYREHDSSVIGDSPLSYVDESLCKVDDIQARLAHLRAAKSVLTTIPGILFTLPYGWLSDHIGRKPVMFLGLLGEVLSLLWLIFVCYFHQVFSTDLVLLSPAFLCVGGGNRVMTTALYATVTDISSEHKKTIIFYIIGAAVLATNLITLPLSSWLLARDLWLPFRLSTPIILSGFPVLFLMPETRPSQSLTCTQPATEEGQSAPTFTVRGLLLSALRNVKDRLKQILSLFAPDSSGREPALSFFLIFLSSFTRKSGSIFIQYASIVLGWPISTIGYILTAKYLVTVFVLSSLAVIARGSRRSPGGSLRLNTIVVLLSLVLFSIGALLMGLGRTASLLITGSILSSGGDGISQAFQGLLASFSDGSSAGQLFAGAALVDLVAVLLGGPAFASLLTFGLHSGTYWGIGTPYFVCAALNLLAAAAGLGLHRSVSVRDLAVEPRRNVFC